MNDRQEPQLPPIPGSWEDLLSKGETMAADNPDEAIPILYRVFNGIGRLPESKRHAGDGRLQKIYERSALTLQATLNLEERYDETLDVLAKIRENTDPEDKAVWDGMTVSVLLTAERLDETRTRLWEYQENLEMQGLSGWGPLLEAYIDAGRVQDAAALIDELQQWVDERHDPESQHGRQDIPPESDDIVGRRSELASIAWMRGVLGVALQQWEEALTWFKQVVELDGLETEHLHFAYTRFLAFGRHAEAAELIELDAQEYPVRASFWKGLSEAMQGDRKAAADRWKRTSEMSPEDEPVSLSEYIMADFYLGDDPEDQIDLLGELIERMPAPPWPVYYLLGMGWASMGDSTAAKLYINIARDMYKSMGQGKLLPYREWLMGQELLDSAVADEIREFFEPAPTPLQIFS